MLSGALSAQAGGTPKGYVNLTGSGRLCDKVEYKTFDEPAFPLQQKLENGKIEEIDFKVEEKLIPRTAFPDSFRVELVTDANKLKACRFRKGRRRAKAEIPT